MSAHNAQHLLRALSQQRRATCWYIVVVVVVVVVIIIAASQLRSICHPAIRARTQSSLRRTHVSKVFIITKKEDREIRTSKLPFLYNSIVDVRCSTFTAATTSRGIITCPIRSSTGVKFLPNMR
jgi:hypothetical protein